MFELLFKYPASAFGKGTFVLLGSWPRWILPVAILATALVLGFSLSRKRERLVSSMRKTRMAVLWSLQSALVALLLLLMWEPALSVSSLKPQQNIIAVVVDDSRSMALKDTGTSRHQEALRLLDSGLLKSLEKRFQVRLYRLGAGVDRIHSTT